MVTRTEDVVHINRGVHEGAGPETHVRDPPQNLNAEASGAQGDQLVEVLAAGDENLCGPDAVRGHIEQNVRVSDVPSQGHEAHHRVACTLADCASDGTVQRHEKANQDRRVGGALSLNNAVHVLGGGLQPALQPSRLQERVPCRRGDLEDRAGLVAGLGEGVVACRVRGRVRAVCLGEEVLGALGQLARASALGARVTRS